ncbi:MAG: hypothetical protein GY927_15930 [bacterium]|nr:hypothetical protein [bacterium]
MNNKTLQRFLAGQHRTNDAFVWLCHKFLLGVDVADPVKSFGDAASQFFMHSHDPELIADAIGEYEISTEVDEADGDMSVLTQLKLSPVANREFLRAEEQARRGENDNEHAVPFEGVAFFKPNGLSLTMRDALTRRPKWHLLYHSAPSAKFEYSGQTMTPLFFGNSEGANSIFRVRVSRKDEAHGS